MTLNEFTYIKTLGIEVGGGLPLPQLKLEGRWILLPIEKLESIIHWGSINKDERPKKKKKSFKQGENPTIKISKGGIPSVNGRGKEVSEIVGKEEITLYEIYNNKKDESNN